MLTFALTDERSQRRFLRECQVAGRLSAHPNIVTVYDAAIGPDGRPFISMELFGDGSIADRLQVAGTLPVGEVLRLGIALAGALETAHRAGVIHRDVKPANVLMTSYGQPALADFGLSVVADRHEASATSEAFTPYHAPPEVLERQGISPASDVYSLASTVYTMLAGRAAHQRDGDDSIAALLLRILQHDVPPLQRPDLPPALPGVLAAAMARDPASRTPAALAFARGLQQAQREMGEPVTEPVVIDQVANVGPSFAAAEPATVHEGNVTVHRDAVRGPAPAAVPPSPPGPPGPPGPAGPDADTPFAPTFDDAPPSAGDTVFRERLERVAPTPLTPAPKQKRRRGRKRPPGGEREQDGGSRTPLLLGSLAGVVVLSGAAFAFAQSGGDDDPPATTTTTEADAPDVAKPTDLTAAESPAGVQLDWTGVEGAAYVVLVLSTEDDPTALPPATGPSRLVPATSLTPETGYCFAVAPVEALDEGVDTKDAFSVPACIRGATEDTIKTG